MRSMIMVVTRPLPVRRSVPSGSSSMRSERSPDADRDVAAGVRQLLALRPDAVRAGDPEGHDRGARPHGEDRHAVLRFLERAVGAARALGEHEQDVALVEDPLGQPERLDIRRATIDRMDAAVGRGPAHDRPVEQLLLAQPVDPPAELGHQPRAEHDGVQVRRVVGGEDERSLARDLVDGALDRDPADSPAEDAAAGRQEGDERRDRALDGRRRGVGRGRGIGHAPAPLGSGSAALRASASRIALTTASTVSSKRLPSVEMIRASVAARSGATARVESSSSRRRRASRMAVGFGSVGIQARAARSGDGPAPRPMPRGRS